MEIKYKNKQIERVCTNRKAAERKHGSEMAEIIFQRIGQIRTFDTVEELVKYRIGFCHQLSGARKGQYAMKLVQPYRLIFEMIDGVIQIAKIIEIVDYH